MTGGWARWLTKHIDQQRINDLCFGSRLTWLTHQSHTTSNLCTMIYDLYNVCRSASNGTLCSGVAMCVKAQVQKFCLGPPHSGIPINLSSGSHQRIRKLISFSRFSIFNLHGNFFFWFSGYILVTTKWNVRRGVATDEPLGASFALGPRVQTCYCYATDSFVPSWTINRPGRAVWPTGRAGLQNFGPCRGLFIAIFCVQDTASLIIDCTALSTHVTD